METERTRSGRGIRSSSSGSSSNNQTHRTSMSDILAIDYSLMSSTLSKEEIGLLQQYQSLAANLTAVKARLEELNEQISTADPQNVANLASLSTDLQKALGVLSTVFKSTVHNVLLHVDSNQLLDGSGANSLKDSDSVAMDYMEDEHAGGEGNAEGSGGNGNGNSSNGNGNSNNNPNGADDDEDVDLGSGIDEETMDAVDRIQHELAMSADIHRQIADQLEINNPDDY